MTRNRHNPDRAPTPAELAAWADGELGPDEAGRIEAYLTDHPDALTDGEAEGRIVRLFRANAPADPAPEAWDRTFNRIDAALSAPPRARRPRRWPGLFLV